MKQIPLNLNKLGLSHLQSHLRKTTKQNKEGLDLKIKMAHMQNEATLALPDSPSSKWGWRQLAATIVLLGVHKALHQSCSRRRAPSWTIIGAKGGFCSWSAPGHTALLLNGSFVSAVPVFLEGHTFSQGWMGPVRTHPWETSMTKRLRPTSRHDYDSKKRGKDTS